MVYWIEQEQGEQSDIAKQLEAAVAREDQEEALRLYLWVVPITYFKDNHLNPFWESDGKVCCWWKYNAAGIVRKYKRPNADYEAAEKALQARYERQNRGYCAFHHCGEYHKELAEIAARFLGGKWKVCYEY